MRYRKILIVAGASLAAGVVAVSTVRLTAEAMGIGAPFSAAALGQVTTTDGIVSGILHVAGDRLSVFSGDRFESTDKDLAIHFESGGAVNLCPRSRMQLVAQQGGNLMLAFDRGGSREAFPFHQGDVIMTPDWRVELAGDVHPGDTALLQVSLGAHGALCIGGQMQSNANLQVMELAGMRVFHLENGQNRRISQNGMEEAGSCGCSDTVTPADAMGGTTPGVVMVHGPAPVIGSAVPRTPMIATLQYPPPVSAAPSISPQKQAAPPLSSPGRRKHPEDVAGYVGAFFRKFFGR